MAVQFAEATDEKATAPLRSLRRDLLVSLVVAAVVTPVSYLIGHAAGWVTEVSWLEALAVATSYVCTMLCIFQRRVNYIVGAISTALYAALFIRYDLVASAVLNIYLTPQLIYGWFRWRRDDVARPVTWLFRDRRWIPLYVLVTICAYLVGVWIVTRLGGQLAWADSAILAGSILAQFLLDNKRIETWFVWIAVNVLAVWTYFAAGLAVAAMQYVAFIATAVVGFIAWRRSMR